MKTSPFMRVFLLALAALIAGSGCLGVNGKGGAFDGVSNAHPAAIGPIAQDAARLMAGFYPPGRTSLRVDAGTGFGRAFENALRQRGFTLSEAGQPVAYQLDMLEPGLCYLSLKSGSNTVVSQSYAVSGAAASPTAASGTVDFIEPPAFVESNIPSTTTTSASVRPASGLGVSGAASGPVSAQGQPGQGGLRLVLTAPAAAELSSGVTRDLSLALLSNGAVMPEAQIRFKKSAAYPNLRDVERRTNGQGQLRLNGLKINDINEPLRATVNGWQEVALYLKGQPSAPAPASGPSARQTNEYNAIVAGLDQNKPESQTPGVTVLAPPAAAGAAAKPSFTETDLSHSGAGQAAAPVSDSAPVAPVMDQTWVINAGLLREQLIGWAQRSGYQVVWKAPSDYDIFADAHFRGSFETAVDQLFQRLYAHGNALRVEIYKGNKVIEVNED